MLSFIDYYEILNNKPLFYAHTHNDKKEILQDHINTSEKYFQKLYDSKNIELVVTRFNQKMHFQNDNASFDFLKDLLIHLVSFHDFGKINPKFQRVKMNNNIGENYDGLVKSNHSFLSAIIYLDYFLDKLWKDHKMNEDDKILIENFILEHAYIISHHHSNLESFSQFLNSLTSIQTQSLIENLLTHPLGGYKGLFYIDNKKLQLLIRHFNLNDKKYSSEQLCFKYFYYRLAYSLLVTSDYYATSEFINQKEFNIFGENLSIQDFQREYNQSQLLKCIRNYEVNKYQHAHKDFEQVTDINELRNELFLDAEKSLLENLDEFIYFLEAPTGSGKSNISINLSFHLMNNRKKLFYIYPFNTLVEQNRNNLKVLFPKKEYQDQIIVVNSLTPFPQKKQDLEDSKEYYQNLLLDRQFLNYPFILSTHVSFFNLLFGSRKEDVIGFHQLSESVIVLDEIQSYRNEIWAEIMIMLKACAELMNMKVIIMSATLPNLEELSMQSCTVKHLIYNPQIYYQHYLFKDRVKLNYELLDEEINLEKLKDHIAKIQAYDKKILVEFITKDSAYRFYKILKKSEDIIVDVKCLTGDDSLIERNKILTPIKNNEIAGLILVATQVIEAGVDIDMDIGYKDISLLDSEEQFLGRINRSCKKEGEVYFFNYDRYSKIYQEDMRANDSLILKDTKMREILTNKDFSQYYHRVMKILKKNRNQRTDQIGLNYFFNELLYKLDFSQISDRMKLINDRYKTVDIVLCRKIELDDGRILDGWNIWNSYKELLQNNDIDYSEKQVKLIEIRSQLSYFVYRFKDNVDIAYNDIIGELRCIEDATDFFIDGKLDRERIGQFSYDFLLI